MGTDEQKIPQEIPGQDKPGDLMDCVLRRGYNMSGVKGSEPLSEPHSSARCLTTVQHEHEAFGLWGQSRVVVNTQCVKPQPSSKNRLRTGKNKVVKMLCLL